MFAVRGDFFDDKAFVLSDFSGMMIANATNFRNSDGDQGCVEGTLRKIGAELSYAVLMVATVIEHLVRIALCLVALIPALLIKGGFDAIKAQFIISVVAIPDHLIRCVVGLVKNIFQLNKNLDYGDLALCERNFPDVERCCAYECDD